MKPAKSARPSRSTSIKIDLDQFRRGLEVEFEHSSRNPETDVTHDDAILTGKIARSHLKEFRDYYTCLAKLEAEAKAYWSSVPQEPGTEIASPIDSL